MKPTIEQKAIINEIVVRLNKLHSKISLSEYEIGEPNLCYIELNKLFDSLELCSNFQEFIRNFLNNSKRSDKDPDNKRDFKLLLKLFNSTRSSMNPDRNWLNSSDWHWYDNYLYLLKLAKEIFEIYDEEELPLSPRMLLKRKEEADERKEREFYSKFYSQLKTINSDELENILNLHELWLLEKENGVKADLSYLRFDNTKDFRCRNLINVNFSNSLIQDFLFIGANLTGADFSNSIIENTNFNYSILKDVNFENAIINGSFEDADLSGTNFELAKEYTPIVKSPHYFIKLTKEEELENVFNYAREKILEEFSQIDLLDKEKLLIFKAKAINMGFIALAEYANLRIQECYQIEQYESENSARWDLMDFDDSYESGKVNGYDIEDAFGGEADAYWNID